MTHDEWIVLLSLIIPLIAFSVGGILGFTTSSKRKYERIKSLLS